MKEIDKEIHEWVGVYKRNNEEFLDLDSKYDNNDLPEVWFFEVRKELLLDGYSEKEIDKGFDRFHK